MSTHVAVEIATQPDCWHRASTLAKEVAPRLPRPGERVAVVGCGTSWFIAQSYAWLREARGLGHTDAFAASEFPGVRDYDRIVAITRSGTTSEVLELLDNVSVPTLAITADGGTPVVDAADELVVLDFADEASVVQTRFATSTLALLRASLGEDLAGAIADASTALTAPLRPEWTGAAQFTFLGRGWTCGLAHEAALKMREAAGAWTESYPAMDYRHGPISITAPGRLAWMFGPAPAGLADDVAATGGTFVTSSHDPMATLVLAQRLAVHIAEAAGLNPDQPRHLTRSVILS
ncbi:fructoselysine-6-P-deglycase FrlB-like protein [Saccharothrix tamanrassetensis]|uniref:Fructoselysine-6-P-deglycase FrlB-like protein n=1 Tax=Saccharothrix tamanrassetensis TaxID=1051531 RepID=A0A841CHS8_9PSEU|nr:SIS domain-containing protein [Saccharothrix tamanrassetensis]MBB5956951.1 fructoselysine-6-P-deglycase FrlB-like protein [Saccharothrix tamanrassetensis]